MLELEGRVAVVTGAARGIGLGLAEKFAAEGMRVVLADLDAWQLEAATTTLRHKGFEVAGEVVDVSSAADMARFAQACLDLHGAVHVLCNNAGVLAGSAPLWECDLAEVQRVVDVNFWGVFWGIRSFVPIMLAQGDHCHVVNTSSMGGLLTSDGMYGVSKHAVTALTEALHVQLTRQAPQIGVSCLMPGFTLSSLGAEQPAHSQRPSLVAEKVVDCIRKRRFWVMPNEYYRPVSLDRVAAAFEGRNPVSLVETLQADAGLLDQG